MGGKILTINIYPVKGEKKSLSEGRLIEGLGLEGDRHAQGGERQVSLLFTDDHVKADPEGKGLCHLRYKENIRCQAPFSVRQGTRLEAGETVLEITGETKLCHEECALFEAGKTCSLAGQNLFAKVVKGGVIRTGDSVEVCQ